MSLGLVEVVPREEESAEEYTGQADDESHKRQTIPTHSVNY